MREGVTCSGLFQIRDPIGHLFGLGLPAIRFYGQPEIPMSKDGL